MSFESNCNTLSDNWEDFFAHKLLAYQERIARYEVEVQASEKLERELEGCVDRTKKLVGPVRNHNLVSNPSN